VIASLLFYYCYLKPKTLSKFDDIIPPTPDWITDIGYPDTRATFKIGDQYAYCRLVGDGSNKFYSCAFFNDPEQNQYASHDNDNYSGGLPTLPYTLGQFDASKSNNYAKDIYDKIQNEPVYIPKIKPKIKNAPVYTLASSPKTTLRNIEGRYLVIRQTADFPLIIAGILPINEFGNNILTTILNPNINNITYQMANDTGAYSLCTSDKSIIQTYTIPFFFFFNFLDPPNSPTQDTTVLNENVPYKISSRYDKNNMSYAVSSTVNGQKILPYLIIDLSSDYKVGELNTNKKLNGFVLFNRTDDIPNGELKSNTRITNFADYLNTAVIELYDSSVQPEILNSFLTNTITNSPAPLPIISWNYSATPNILSTPSTLLKYKLFTIDLLIYQGQGTSQGIVPANPITTTPQLSDEPDRIPYE
jgi:hypothetical protein